MYGVTGKEEHKKPDPEGKNWEALPAGFLREMEMVGREESES